LLKNKKNLLIIGIVAALVVIVGVAAIFLLEPGLFGGGNSNPAASPSVTTTTAPVTPASTPAAPAAQGTPGAPAPAAKTVASKTPSGKAAAAKAKANAKMAAAKVPGKPGATAANKPGAANKAAAAKKLAATPGKPAAPGTVQVASTAMAPPNPRPDPFLIPGTGINRAAPRQPVTALAPTHIITNWHPYIPPPPTLPTVANAPGGQAASLPGDRVAGIMMNNGVYAIMESNGQSQVVQPGDTLPGGERVVSIQNDSVTLRTTGNQVVNLPISAGSGGTMPGYPGGMPAGYNPGGAPPGYPQPE